MARSAVRTRCVPPPPPVVKATNRDLLAAVREGRFREDLYYRLAVFPVQLPALRERRKDIPLLAQFLVNRFAARVGKPIRGIMPATMRRLVEYPWPGNVRELENLLERTVILAQGDLLDIDASLIGPTPLIGAVTQPLPPPAPTVTTTAAPTSLEGLERQHILAVLNETQWVIEGARSAARILDLHPNTLRSRLKKLGLRRPSAHERS